MARPLPLSLGYNVLLVSFMDRNDLHGRHPHISLSWDDMVEIRFFFTTQCLGMTWSKFGFFYNSVSWDDMVKIRFFLRLRILG